MTADDVQVYWAWRAGDAGGGAAGDGLLLALAAEVWAADPALASVMRRKGVPWVRLDGGAAERWVPASVSSAFVSSASTSSGREVRAAACLGPGAGSADSGPDRPGPAVGIDAEVLEAFLRSGTQPGAFAEVVLASAEREWFRAAAGEMPARRLALLLRTWVRKEAVLKLLHTGLNVARGGLAPQEVALSAPWEEPVCLSHPEVRLEDSEVQLPLGGGTLLVSAAVREG